MPNSYAPHRSRKSTSRGTPSYQLGHYEMCGEKGKRRSVFKVDVHLSEHPAVEGALSAWSQEIDRLRQIGRESKADKPAHKFNRLKELTFNGHADPCLTPTRVHSGRVKLVPLTTWLGAGEREKPLY